MVFGGVVKRQKKRKTAASTKRRKRMLKEIKDRTLLRNRVYDCDAEKQRKKVACFLMVEKTNEEKPTASILRHRGRKLKNIYKIE